MATSSTGQLVTSCRCHPCATPTHPAATKTLELLPNKTLFWYIYKSCRAVLRFFWEPLWSLNNSWVKPSERARPRIVWSYVLFTLLFSRHKYFRPEKKCDFFAFIWEQVVASAGIATLLPEHSALGNFWSQLQRQSASLKSFHCRENWNKIIQLLEELQLLLQILDCIYIHTPTETVVLSHSV